MKTHTKALPLAFALLFGSANPSFAAELPGLPAGSTVKIEGPLVMHPGGKQAAWLEFRNYLRISQPATQQMRDLLTQRGWKWAETEAESATSISITGFVRIHNEIPSNRDTGKVEIAAILEEGLDASLAKQNPVYPQSSGQRAVGSNDAGVAHALSRGGMSLGGSLVASMGIDWIAEATGLRAAVNGLFTGNEPKVKYAPILWRDKPIFCFEECTRKFETLHHVVELNYRAIHAKQGTPYHTITVELVSNKREDPTPLIAYAMLRLIDNMDEGAKE